MEALVRGVHYFCRNCPNECYYWENPNQQEIAKKVSFPFDPDPYPFIIVNIGSGVSILHVFSASEFKRIGGKTLKM